MQQKLTYVGPSQYSEIRNPLLVYDKTQLNDLKDESWVMLAEKCDLCIKEGGSCCVWKVP